MTEYTKGTQAIWKLNVILAEKRDNWQNVHKVCWLDNNIDVNIQIFIRVLTVVLLVI